MDLSLFSFTIPVAVDSRTPVYFFHYVHPPDKTSCTGYTMQLLMKRRTGISITQSWNTANLLSTKVELNDTLASGLKTEILNNFKPDAGNQGQKVNFLFKQNNFHGRVFGDLKASGAVSATADAVLSHEGFLVGGEVGYDVQKAAITKYSAAVGYTTPIYNAAITATNSLSVFSAAYYHKVNTAVEAGARATWDSKAQGAVGFELAAKYKIDPASFAKVSKTLRVARSISDTFGRPRSTTSALLPSPTTPRSTKA